MEQKTEWFWAHRRTASLHHFSFLMHGMRNKGWLPAANFWLDNQIVVGVPGKGSYVFYDKNELGPGKEKYRDIQESIDRNPTFAADIHTRTDELFSALFSACHEIDSSNLSQLSLPELKSLYDDTLSAFMAGPIITLQVWGIEACFDESYRIMRFLRSRLAELHKGRDFELYKSMLAVNIGETVAFTERKNFYEVAVGLAKNPQVKSLFAGNSLEDISSALKQYSTENSLLEDHAQKYEWMNKEYVGGGWSREKWIDLLKQTITNTISPQEKLNELLSNFESLNAERNKVIAELNPPADVRQSIDALAELIAQRDWSKGYITKAFLSYHRLLDEIARRMGTSRETLFFYSYIEVGGLLALGKKVPDEEILSRRKDGFIIRIRHGEFELISGKDAITQTIANEGISEPFEKIINTKEFKGLAASRGIITGKARVLEDASRIAELEQGEILVTYMTTIEFIPAFRKAAAVVTDEGGMSCHAAIISREFKLPCVVGTKVATRAIKTGDRISVDAIQGVVTILESSPDEAL